jgi:hypothetical protein
MGVVKIVTNKPGPGPKPTEYAQIDKQGRIPYGKTAEVKVPMTMGRATARGMGAAVKGGGYNSCS